MDSQQVRDALLQALEADLIGPFDSGGAEVLPLPPSRWYLTGFLVPQGGAIPEDDDRADEAATAGKLDRDIDADSELAAGDDVQTDDAGNADPEPKRRAFFPASMGLSVFLPPAPRGGDATEDTIEVTVRYADYQRVLVAEDHEDEKRVGWKRRPRRPAPIDVPMNRDVLEGPGMPVPESGGLILRGELRETHLEGLPKGSRVLSLFLVNERTPQHQHRDERFAFQVSLSLRARQGFLPRPNRHGETGAEYDQRILALQYRDASEWAVGHNTSVLDPEASMERGSPSSPSARVHVLRTTQLPHYEVRRVEHQKVRDLELEMERLAQLDEDPTALRRALEPLIERYGDWIDMQRQIALDRESLDDTRGLLLADAEATRTRLREGIDLLARDETVRRAFCWSNLAMSVSALQADKGRDKKRYADGTKPSWRPFQLAFVLLNLASVDDVGHPHRKTADLVYFPTGGGKTEAYLGLIATTLILRRLRGKRRPDQGRGVAVILRYTLRLLTLDQLGRAATLICALEEMRRRRPEALGNSRFTVGLWVGATATANRLKDVQRVLNDHTPGRPESPFPLTACPWCDQEIRNRNVQLVDASGRPHKTKYERAVVYCDGEDCLFTERERRGQGLPVLFVDEQIYREVPDFLVATVDKFAMLPWRTEAGRLFGRATHLDDRRIYGVGERPPKEAEVLPDGLYPPELIVQDEMHLISGPLGTMVGLYEAAIDYLSEREVDGARRVPKVICSTATVRRAREQIRALFDREMAIFPPRGVDAHDNFFATVDEKSPGRLYVGVAAPGRALRAVSVRVYATLLAAAQRHFDPTGPADQAADPYLTLVGYFNSLRELGGMRRLVEDEVRTRVKDFTRGKRPHHHIGPHPWAADRRLLMPEELTSRESSQRIKETKQRLATPKAAGDGSLDTVLASSMISVGLDIDRLGLMVVTGQPKTTSEYIQATSRVGRAHPGLVVTCLNASRPRDRSHYERFVAYHRSFYREVEATSVTPFSLQTLDRGMIGALVGMIRHATGELTPPVGFMELRKYRQLAEHIVEALVDRGRHHREWPDEVAEGRIEDELRQRGLNFLDAWDKVLKKAVDGAATRTYSGFDRAHSQGKPVLRTAVEEPAEDLDERRFVAPTSMRDVEPNTHLWIRFAPLDQGGS